MNDKNEIPTGPTDRPMYFDRLGEPISQEHWGELLGDESYKRVARTEGMGVTVSTVWLGLDHQTVPGLPPLIFETTSFGGGEQFEEQWRYSTEQEAKAGHFAACRLVWGDD